MVRYMYEIKGAAGMLVIFCFYQSDYEYLAGIELHIHDLFIFYMCFIV